MEHKIGARVGRRGAGWFFSYTFWYLLIALGIYAIFALDGKTLIWDSDGLRQVYNTISYVSAHVRSFFATGHLTFDMMDFKLGQGMDTLACMCYYGLTDPLVLLSALTTGDGIEVLYAILIGVRVYLAGAAFGLYLRYTFKTEGWATAASSILYAFSGFLLYAAVRHPQFANGALYLPLVLYGVEKLLRERKPHALIGFAALMLVVNFFFAYINTLLAVLYIVMRLAFRFGERHVRGTAADGFSLLGSYLLGMTISAAVFFPMAYLFLQNGRVDLQTGYTDSLLFYPIFHYASLLENIVQPAGNSSYWAIVGFTPISLFCVTLLLFKRNKSRAEAQILVGIAALTLFAFVPLFGKIFNGFDYVTNRWSYALAFPICAASAVMLPELATLGKKKLAVLGAFWGTYVALAVVVALYMGKIINFAAGISATVACYLALVIVRAVKLKSKLAFQALISLIVFAYAFCVYSPLMKDYVAEFNDRGVYGRIMNGDLAALRLVDDDGVYRATETNINDPLSALIGYMPVTYYWSIVPACTADYQMNVMLSSRPAFHNVYGLDGRTTLCALAGLKYVVRARNSLSLLPYGSYPVAETGDAVVYENPYALPLGYAFTQAISEDALDALTPVDRELAYARFAVLADASEGGVPVGTYASTLEELPWALNAVEGVEIQDHRIVSKDGGTFRMDFDAPAGYDIYIVIDGLVSKRASTTRPAVLEFSSGGVTGRGFLTNNRSTVCYGQTGLLLDLGCTDEARDGADLTVRKAAKIDYDAIHVYAVPIEDVTAPLEALAGRAFKNVRTSANRISGNITLDEPAVLQLSVQYGKGWSATVDGKDAEVFRSGGMYAAVRLDAGEHTVVLSYRTPYIIQCAVLSGAGILIWIALAVWRKRRAVRRI